MQMKQIMNEWRRYVLSERKSDISYNQAVKFFIEMLDEKYVKVSIATPGDLLFLFDPVLVFFNNEKNASNNVVYIKLNPEKLKDLWTLYKSIVDEDIFFYSFENFQNYMEKFNITAMYEFYQGGAKIAGLMHPSGEMMLFIGDDVNATSNKTILDKIKVAAYDTFTHEGTHYLNTIRAKGESNRSAGGKRQYDVSTQEYIDSTEELQARYVQATNTFSMLPIKGKKFDLYEYLLDNPGGNDGIRLFIKEFISHFYDYPLESHSKEIQNKLLGRIYQFALQIKESDEFKDFSKPRTTVEL